MGSLAAALEIDLHGTVQRNDLDTGLENQKVHVETKHLLLYIPQMRLHCGHLVDEAQTLPIFPAQRLITTR